MEAQNFALFFSLLPPQFFSFFPLLRWCLKRWAMKCARLEFSGCRVKPSKNTTKIPQREERKKIVVEAEGGQGEGGLAEAVLGGCLGEHKEAEEKQRKT